LPRSELHAPVGGETVVVVPPEEAGLDPVKEDDFEEDEAPPEVAFVLEGDGFRRMGRTDEALACYERAIRALFDRARLRAHGQVDVAGLARAQVRIGNAHFDAGDHTKALTALDRAGDLVRELAGGLDAAQSIDRKAGTDDAALVLLERLDPKKARFVCLRLRGQVEMGLGQALVEIAEYDQGQTALEKARETYAVLGDVRMRAEVSRALAECARRQHLREDVIASHEAAASEVDEEVALRLKEGAGKLLRMKERLFSTSAKQGKVTPLKRQSARALRLVNEQQAYKDRIVQCKEERGEQEKTTAKVEQLRERIDAQLKEAKTSDKDEMSSTLGRRRLLRPGLAAGHLHRRLVPLLRLPRRRQRRRWWGGVRVVRRGVA
jgi:tetratricopeptide (TPR) repeat protein